MPNFLAIPGLSSEMNVFLATCLVGSAAIICPFMLGVLLAVVGRDDC